MNVFGPTLGAVPDVSGRTRFCVWAPRAERLTLVLPEHRERAVMTRDANGYHHAATHAPPGTLYLFEFDDGRRRPDPASMAQPTAEGVHGASMVVSDAGDDGALGYRNPPLERHVLYELHVGTFTPEGTFDGVISRLDDLKRLGVTAIELMPIAQFPGERNWGYDGVGLFAAQWSYGGIDGLRRLTRACHERGMGVIIDVVYNHVGPEGNYLREFGGYFSDRYKTPWGDAMNFDGPGSDQVREFFVQNALHWVERCGADGLRLDAVHAIMDRSSQPFLKELGERVRAAGERSGRRVLIIAESSDNDPRLVRSREVGGVGLDGCWNDEFHHAVRTVLTGETRGYYREFGSVEQVAKCVRDRYVFAGEYSAGYQRRHGAAARDVSHGRLVTFTQNHDQVGNRARGDRLDATAGDAGARVAAGLVMMGPFTPMLWMGEEYGENAPFQYFVSHTDEALIEAVRHGRKSEFADFHEDDEVPDPQDVNTFKRSKLRWERRAEAGHLARLKYYTELLRMRRAVDVPSKTAACDAWSVANTGVLVAYPGVMIAANMKPTGLEVDLSRACVFGRQWRVVLDSEDDKWGGAGANAAILENAGGERLSLPGRTFVVMQAGERPA